MRNSLIAIIAAAAVAGMITFITEPTVGAKSGMPQPGVSGISQPAVKGDRLEPRPSEACSLPKESAEYRSDCIRTRAKSPPLPSEIRIGSVDRWPIELSSLFVAA
jgi:hypothetical protein